MLAVYSCMKSVCVSLVTRLEWITLPGAIGGTSCTRAQSVGKPQVQCNSESGGCKGGFCHGFGLDSYTAAREVSTEYTIIQTGTYAAPCDSVIQFSFAIQAKLQDYPAALPGTVASCSRRCRTATRYAAPDERRRHKSSGRAPKRDIRGSGRIEVCSQLHIYIDFKHL